ncbi:uncharacterized protein N7498_008230 [Penicillium cinerascens]|uniref:2EXR domain-containing protein n=1 Tax=Penicillium cinerascens TaxID=70096 RepID=A0A9W9JEI3_9EURO|nr:uncharacterized protein N7498_008230 [Penicillium cinerascens]KAJ5194792.1 hypothetical protein N7498_008230 [Penicillium cinerascens]
MRDRAISPPSPRPHLQIFNFLQAPSTLNSSFTLFPLLPPEIRLLIWHHSLRRQRIVDVALEACTQRDAPYGCTDGKQHRAVVSGHQVLSKLLRVNSEARQAALSFYRVHIPCQFFTSDREHVPTTMTFYFNPEYDMLRFFFRNTVSDAFIHFLYHLKHTYDPQRAGLLRLAVDIDSLSDNALRIFDLSRFENDVRECVVDTLNQLQEVFFIEVVSIGRQILGYMSGINTSDNMFNRSFPILTATTLKFDRLPRDPRHIAEDLGQLHMGHDPRNMVLVWRDILKKWAAVPSQAEYKLLLAFSPPGQNLVSDRKSADAWLQNEEDEWTGKWRLGDRLENGNWALRYWGSTDRFSHCQVGALHEKYRNEDLEKAVKPAFGFWLFPLEVLGSVTVEELDRWNWPELCIMTDHWPELALSDLPGK